MNRNHEHVPTAGERFSEANPPFSEEVAKLRLDKIETDIEQIKASLDHADPNAWASDQEYRTWRFSASHALGILKREVTFLERWLGHVRHSEENSRHEARQVRFEQHADVAHERARELADQLEREFAPVYSTESPPKSVVDARDRLGAISAFRTRIQAAFAEVTSLWTDHKLAKASMPGVKAPITKVLAAVDAETAAIKAYVRAQEHSLSSIDWRGTCTSALTRAVSQGFVLTAVELEVVNRMLAYGGEPPIPPAAAAASGAGRRVKARTPSRSRKSG